MTTQSVIESTRYSPLPICPPLSPGESFTSWMSRIAARNHLPLGLLLARLAVATSDRHTDMPNDYGMSLTDEQVGAIAAMTGTAADKVHASLLDTYHGGPLDLTAYYDNNQRGLITVARSEWVHLTRSPFCPDCLRETRGAWQLAWRLPWSFVCPTHQTLLAPVCPGCDQPSGRLRGDRTLRPGFIADIPQPEHCCNSINAHDAGYASRPGRAAKPCGYDLAETLTTHIGDLAPVTTSQATLHQLLNVEGHRNTWRDLRALVATLMYFADTGTLTNLAPEITETLFSEPSLVDAVRVIEDDRAARTQVQQRVRDGGRDHRTGTRQRYGTATPIDPALMAVLTPIALYLYGDPLNTEDPDARSNRLHDLARLARNQGKKLGQMLNASGASTRFVDAADAASRATGRFYHAANGTAAGAVDPSAVPAYLWETEAEPFIALLPGTREDSARMFASMTIVKQLTGDSWVNVTTRLGLPAHKAKLTPSLVNRLTKTGNQPAFQTATQSVIDRLINGDLPTVDYADRRRRLRQFKAVPAHVFHQVDPTLIATSARRHNAAAWLWAHLTGGHPWEAPAWGKDEPPESKKEVYRRFLARDLDRLRSALVTYGDTLVEQ